MSFKLALLFSLVLLPWCLGIRDRPVDEDEELYEARRRHLLTRLIQAIPAPLLPPVPRPTARGQASSSSSSSSSSVPRPPGARRTVGTMTRTRGPMPPRYDLDIPSRTLRDRYPGFRFRRLVTRQQQRAIEPEAQLTDPMSGHIYVVLDDPAMSTGYIQPPTPVTDYHSQRLEDIGVTVRGFLNDFQVIAGRLAALERGQTTAVDAPAPVPVTDLEPQLAPRDERLAALEAAVQSLREENLELRRLLQSRPNQEPDLLTRLEARLTACERLAEGVAATQPRPVTPDDVLTLMNLRQELTQDPNDLPEDLGEEEAVTYPIEEEPRRRSIPLPDDGGETMDDLEREYPVEPRVSVKPAAKPKPKPKAKPVPRFFSPTLVLRSVPSTSRPMTRSATAALLNTPTVTPTTTPTDTPTASPPTSPGLPAKPATGYWTKTVWRTQERASGRFGKKPKLNPSSSSSSLSASDPDPKGKGPWKGPEGDQSGQDDHEDAV